MITLIPEWLENVMQVKSRWVDMVTLLRLSPRVFWRVLCFGCFLLLDMFCLVSLTLRVG